MTPLSPIQVTAAVTVAANLLAECMTEDELALYSAVFAQLGDTLATIAVLKASKDEDKEKDEVSE